nr:MAG TPA: hypothetical protein [Caudoviricetes sp.]
MDSLGQLRKRLLGDFHDGLRTPGFFPYPFPYIIVSNDCALIVAPLSEFVRVLVMESTEEACA